MSVPGFVLIDTSDFKAFAKALHASNLVLEKELQTALTAAGELVAVQARRNAKSFPRKGPGTSRIADSIKTRRRGLSVKVQAGGPNAPEAAPIENGGNSGTFRHPLPNDNRDQWYSQPAHPFLTPAVEDTMPAVISAVDVALDATIEAMVL